MSQIRNAKDGHFSTLTAEKFSVSALGKAVVTQDTSISTAVTANGAAGAVTTQAAGALAAGANVETFVVNNDAVHADSLVLASIAGYAGTLVTNGLPAIHVSGVAAGQFSVNISNNHPSNDLAGALEIHFQVL